MSVLPRPNLTTGDPYTVSFTVTVNNAAIAPGTAVKAALKAFTNDLMFATTTCTEALGTWTATFSTSQTAALLQTPTDLASKLHKTITTNLDEASGFGQVKLEIQVGAPYFLTWAKNLTVDKGLIP